MRWAATAEDCVCQRAHKNQSVRKTALFLLQFSFPNAYLHLSLINKQPPTPCVHRRGTYQRKNLHHGSRWRRIRNLVVCGLSFGHHFVVIVVCRQEGCQGNAFRNSRRRGRHECYYCTEEGEKGNGFLTLQTQYALPNASCEICLV